MTTKYFSILTIIMSLGYNALACTPCGQLSNINQNISGNTLTLNFTSNAGWQCCYNVQIELVCIDANFTGTANYLSPQLCINGGSGAASTWGTPTPYPPTTINLAGFCPGTYKWRARETQCNLAWTQQYTFTIAGANPMTLSASAVDPNLCLGESTQLLSQAANGCNGPYNYSWSPSAGLSNPNTQNPTAAPSVTTTYTVTSTEAGACASTQTAQVTVTVLPKLDIVLSGNSTVCAEDAEPIVTFTANNSAPPYTIDYTINGVLQPTLVMNGTTQEISQSTAIPGTYVYEIISATDSSPTEYCEVEPSIITILVNTLPAVDAGPDQAVCDGTSVVLEAIGATSYSWNNAVTNGTAFTPSVGTINYTVTGTSLGCIGQDNVNVTVHPNPFVNGGFDITLCEGETAILTGSGAATYTWTNNVVNSIPFTPAVGTFSYSVTGTSIYGCTGTDDMSITVYPNPNVTFFPDTTIGCIPFLVTFTNTTPNTAGCTWTISNGQTLSGCDPTLVFFNNSGCFDVTLSTISNEGCESSFTASNLICVEPPPAASFIATPGSVTTLNTEVNFLNTSTGANSYLWNFGDGSSETTEESPVHFYPDNSTAVYDVYLIAYSPLGCTDTATSYIQVVEEVIYYVPNTFTPDLDNYNPVFKPIFTAGFDPYSYNLLIFNRWGEIIFESNDSDFGWDGSYGSDGEYIYCPDGSYTWRIEFKVSRWDERKIITGHVNLIR